MKERASARACDRERVRVCMCMSVRVCMCMLVRVCMCMLVHVCMCMSVRVCMCMLVRTIKILGLFCKRALDILQKRPVQSYTYTSKRGQARCMWWLRLVGSLKLQVSFAEYRLFNRALLQKRPKNLRSLLIVATPYQCHIRRHTQTSTEHPD